MDAAHKIKSLQLMLKLNYHHFAVGRRCLITVSRLFYVALESIYTRRANFPHHFPAKGLVCLIRFVAKISQRIHHADCEPI
jgi:hypothetical protein